MKITAVLGTYRKGKFIDSIIDEMIMNLSEKGHETEKIYLIDKNIEFCTNCRRCMNQDAEIRIVDCRFDDDMKQILEGIDQADALILASPTNVGAVTAVMKKFIERLSMAVYWPKKSKMPKPRIKAGRKKAVVVTSSAMPGFVLKIVAPSILNIMRDAARFLGYGNIKKHAFGLVGRNGGFIPGKRQKKKARELAGFLCSD